MLVQNEQRLLITRLYLKPFSMRRHLMPLNEIMSAEGISTEEFLQSAGPDIPEWIKEAPKIILERSDRQPIFMLGSLDGLEDQIRKGAIVNKTLEYKGEEGYEI